MGVGGCLHVLTRGARRNSECGRETLPGGTVCHVHDHMLRVATTFYRDVISTHERRVIVGEDGRFVDPWTKTVFPPELIPPVGEDLSYLW